MFEKAHRWGTMQQLNLLFGKFETSNPVKRYSTGSDKFDPFHLFGKTNATEEI